jgi:hypothetical protein
LIELGTIHDLVGAMHDPAVLALAVDLIQVHLGGRSGRQDNSLYSTCNVRGFLPPTPSAPRYTCRQSVAP